jgi:UDP-N-acetyl-D-mannosaminuronic acid dehydrogenase
MRSICVVGLGYIGLPTAAVLAAHDLKVIGVDIDKYAVETINQGKTHIVEPDLDALVHEVVRKGSLRAQATPEPSDVFIIAVPTPFGEGKQPDLSYVKSAALSIAPVLSKGNLVILESTSPVGTTEQVAAWLAEARPDLNFPMNSNDASDINIAYCPERVLPGKILQELVQNDRVIGGITPSCAQRASILYRSFVRGNCLLTKVRVAEMCKLTENSFRDLNIAFANEISVICDELKINVWELINLANRHPRVDILQPGPGVGGHCIAVDPWFIVSSAPNSARIIRMAREVNDQKPLYVVNQVRSALSANRVHKKIACLGLTFKPDIDDLRESPAVEIVKLLAQDGGIEILAVEPYIKSLPRDFEMHKNIRLTSCDEAIKNADIILLLVNHRVFYQLDPKLMSGKTVIDTRGVF